MLKGIDISKYQIATPSLAGLSFIVLRATIATTKDSLYDMHYANARKAGLVVMAYHFGYPASASLSIAAQANLFLSVAKDADYLWLDQEKTGFDDAQAQQFIDLVRSAGRKCGLYHSASGFGGVNADAKWVADWRAASVAAGHPLNAAGTAEFTGWDLWQYAGSPIDSDYLNPATTLRALLAPFPAAVADCSAQVAAVQKQLDLCTAAHDADVDSLAIANLTVAQSKEAIAALSAALDAAPAAERERIALAEAARVRSI